MNRLLLVLSLLVPSIASAYPLTPDRDTNPGDLCEEDGRDFKELRYREQVPICARNVSNILKRTVYDAYGIPEREREDYTIDHIIPLSIGGSNDFRNLWPEHKKVKATRPNFEQDLYNKIYAGEITQAAAVAMVMKEKFKERISFKIPVKEAALPGAVIIKTFAPVEGADYVASEPAVSEDADVEEEPEYADDGDGDEDYYGEEEPVYDLTPLYMGPIRP